MKNTLLLTLLMVLVIGTLKAQCPEQNITLLTQEEVDNFSINYPNCTELLGDLLIGTNDMVTEISNLEGLNQIVSISESLEFLNNDSLTSLSGLEGLQSIEGGLIIKNNPNLIDISAFESLSLIARNGYDGQLLWVELNDKLTSLAALGNASFTNGNVHISKNNVLTNLIGLENMVTLDEINIYSNDLLEDLSGLENLTFARVISISENNILSNLSGLLSVTSIGSSEFGTSLLISANPSLVNLTGLESLVTITGSVTIRANGQLVDLSGLASLVSVSKGLNINSNSLLNDLTGLESLESINSLIIKSCDSLTSIQNLSNLHTFTGSLIIDDNSLLSSLAGLEGINQLETVTIMRNTSLNDLSALSDLTTVNSLQISSNNSLENLSGLENLSSIPGLHDRSIQITNNSNLIDISALNPTGSIVGLIISGNFRLPTISGLSEIDTIKGLCEIDNNHILTDISGLNSVKSIGQNSSFTIDNFFTINENDSLVNISGFNNLEIIHKKLEILNNPLLSSLDGFIALDSIKNGLHVSNCNALEDFSGLSSAVHLAGEVTITENPSLTTCEFPALCNYILDGGVPEISNNAGCSTLSDLLLACLEENTIIVGSVFLDTNLNCIADSSEFGIENWLVNASNEEYSYTISTDSLGNYWIPLLEGDWNFNFIPPSSFWNACFEDSLVVSTGLGDTILLDGVITPQAECPYLEWEVSTTPLRICTTSTYIINYCNYGAQAAIDHMFSVLLNDDLTFENSAFPHTIDSEGVIHFEIDSIGIFDCGQISFTAMVDCDSVELGDLMCFEVSLSPDDLCSTNPAWDESTITANGYCENDSIFFELENIGLGNMSQSEQFIIEIVIDDIVLIQDVDDFQLGSGEKKIISYEKNGMGMRLETQQSADHPVGGIVSTVVPNCDSDSNNIVFILLPMADDGDPFYEQVCVEVTGAYDPNIKSAIPVGIGPNHEIAKEWPLEYTIQFQNTGNDTAFLVVLKDTLSEHLDLSTIQVKGSSHDYTWNLNPNRELVFTFENILLVDSFTNEPGSHGFILFEITPSTNSIPGDLIENRAGIYFDFNDPIITNTVWHTIRKSVVASSEHSDWCAGEDYNGLGIIQDTSFQSLTEFVEYDSVHFVHLEVNPISDSMVIAEILVGEYFNDVLISGDTIFTVSHTNYIGCDSLVTYTITALFTSTNASNILEKTKVFPNPFNDKLQVLGHQNGEIQYWTISNNLGQVIWRKTLLAEEQISPVEMNHFSAGVYWLKVKTKGSTVAWRIVKQ